MLDLCSWIFICVFGGTFIFSFVYSCIKVYIAKKYFNRNCLRRYESDIEAYHFSLEDDMEKIAEKVKKELNIEK